jgi:hypothetical protein
MVQGAIMAIEDGWVLAERDKALAAYDAVRPPHWPDQEPPHYPVFPLPSVPGGLEVEELAVG